MNAAPLTHEGILAPHAPPEGGTFDLLEPAPTRSWLRRTLGALIAPPPSETEIAVRLLCAWTIGKSADHADEALQGLAVLTARQLLTLTGGR